MVNSNRNRKNQPPTGIGKKQPRQTRPKVGERSVVAQAAPSRDELNYATSEEEEAARGPRRAIRPKAGR